MEKLCGRLTEVAGTGETIDLRAAVTALVRDVAFGFILAKGTNSLDRQDFDVEILKTVQGGGALWRVTKHVGFVLPLLNPRLSVNRGRGQVQHATNYRLLGAKSGHLLGSLNSVGPLLGLTHRGSDRMAVQSDNPLLNAFPARWQDGALYGLALNVHNSRSSNPITRKEGSGRLPKIY